MALKRVMILDFDVHHGNGTQEIFYDDPSVLFISLHLYGRFFYPGTGAAQEIGHGLGAGQHYQRAAAALRRRCRIFAGFAGVDLAAG